MIIHESPDEAVRERIAHLKTLKRKGGLIKVESGALLTPYAHQLRRYILEDWWFLARAVLGMHWLDENLHGRELMSHYFRKDSEGNLTDNFDKATLVPRGHVKTLFLGASRQIQRVLQNPEIKILYASATVPLARSVGMFFADSLLNNEALQTAFPDILPKAAGDCTQWGIQGYRLPNIVSTDPTFRTASLDTNITGAHPWIVVCDDLIVEQTNNERGWAQAEQFIKNCLAMLPPHGFFEWLATRWHDADTSGKILSGAIRGKQGEFQCKTLSCFVDDDPKKGVIWPAKKRWGSNTVSGYTLKQFEDMKHTMGSFFNAQMRNDPVPEEDQVINYKDIVVVSEDKLPEHGPVRLLGVEATGGGNLLFEHLLERSEKFGLTIPLVKIQNPKHARAGLTKTDAIVTELEPIIREGRLHAVDWMMQRADSDESTLAYEVKRLGAAKHDDIIDCLHNITHHLVKKTFPDPREKAHLYIGVDLAFTATQGADFSVVMAVSVDHKGNYYIHDYDRFKSSNPTVIADRIIHFHSKFSKTSLTQEPGSRNKRSFAATYK